MGAAGQGGGYEIDQSIRFNDGDSSKLTGSTGQTGDGTQWTISMWIKRGEIDGGNKTIWSAGDGSNKRAFSRFVSGGSGSASEDISFSVRTGGSWYELNVDVSFRDPSAWYHLVWVWDSDNGTAADRMRIYVNGDRLTSFSNTPSYPASATATDSWNNSSYAHQIGFENNTRFFDGYLAEMYHIDGQALTPTSFGETNDDGVWIPIDASGLTFGTRGFYLKGETSSDLGNDSSGNNNDFTSSGLATTDQMLDTPTLNWCTWNPLDKNTSITLSEGNLKLAVGAVDSSVRSTFAASSGKWYWEITITSSSGHGTVGVTNSLHSLSSTPGSSTVGVGYRCSDGGKVINGTYTASYGASYTTGDVIGVALNMEDGEVTFYKNNASQGVAATGLSGTLFAAAGNENVSSLTWTANFGQTAFTYTPPTDFLALNTANLATPSITDGSAYFQTSLWNGNGSTQTITQSGNSTFEPGMIWSKGRNNVQEHVIFDQVRGATKYIQTDNSGAEGTQSGVTAFNSDGFDLGSWAVSNGSGQTHVGWQWKANGAGSSNTDGDITSTVSANTTAGFSIVKYSGNGSDNQTIGHGLGIAPKMIISKRTDTTGNWTTYHDTVGINQVFYLDLTNAPTSNTEQYRAVPTSSVYTIGVGGDINNSSGTYVAYVFAEIPGYSSIGSYTGNSSTDGTFVYTGFKPSFILTKNINTTDQWGIRDATRNPFNVTDKLLNPNAVSAETSAASGYIDILSNGFKPRSSDSNINTQTIIYMAFAENPFGGDGVAPATAR